MGSVHGGAFEARKENMKRLIELLRDPILDGLDVDGENRLKLHRKMLENKRMLREVFTDFHHLFRATGGQERLLR